MSKSDAESTKSRDTVKIASFRTKEGTWEDFSNAAAANGLTATDVLRACMQQYIAGDYNPFNRRITRTSVSTRTKSNLPITGEEVREIVNTAIREAINTLSIPTEADIQRSVRTVLEQSQADVAESKKH
jgi:antitoxin component of RelBE/YafQ-DinJ toxin-antitoxin module